MYMDSIEVKNLYKKYKISQRQEGFIGMVKYLFHPQYKEKEAVKGISFSIQQGECVAFLGANGAGKSTTIKMLTGIMKPTDGKISVMGNDPFRERIRNGGKIGVVFGQKTQLWWDISVKDSFELLHSIYEIPDNVYGENLDLFFADAKTLQRQIACYEQRCKIWICLRKSWNGKNLWTSRQESCPWDSE